MFVLTPGFGKIIGMAIGNQKMNEHEREIGERLKLYREGIRFSQASFSNVIGISRDQLASVECGRTPLKYSIAWEIRSKFRVSINWLWCGDPSPHDLSEDTILPSPDSVEVGKNALLTEVFHKFHKLEGHPPPLNPKTEIKVKKVKVDRIEIGHRWMYAMLLRLESDNLIANVPDGYVVDFYNKVKEFTKVYLEALPRDSRELIDARMDGMEWVEMRSKVIASLPTGEGWNKNNLTDAESLDNNSDVKSPLPAFLERIKKASSATGKKSELAKFLGAPLASVSRWLSGEREPGGEITLKMLKWVEQQERQK